MGEPSRPKEVDGEEDSGRLYFSCSIWFNVCGGKEDSFLNFEHYFPWNLLILYRATLRRRLGQSDDVTRQSCNWVPSTHSIQGNIVHWNIHPISLYYSRRRHPIA